MASPTLAHDAMFYGSDREFAAALTPFVRDGLAGGDAVVAAVTVANAGVLRDALGPDAAAVTFIDRDQWYQRPASTVAGWHGLVQDATSRGHRHVRLIGEVGFGVEERHPTWTRYESAVNRVFADAPAWIVCPYDSRALPAVWARMKIADLADQSTYEGGRELAGEVKQVALEYGLMSSFTSFVAVDSMTRTAGAFGTSVAVPVPVPDGVRYETAVQGGTAAAPPTGAAGE